VRKMSDTQKFKIEKPGSQEKLFKYVTVQPIALILIVVVIFPFLYAIFLSLTNAHVANFRHPKMVWLGNYATALFTLSMWKAIFRSIVYVIFTVSLETGLGLLIAVALNRKVGAKKLFVVLFVLPMLISPVLVGIMFRLEGNFNFGILQYFATKWFGIKTNLYGPKLAFLSMMLIDVWQWTSFMFLIIYAGIAALPQEPYEAAAVDGASAWQTFWTVTLPLLRPVLLIALIFRIMDSFKAFDHINLLTGGGPGDRTTTISVHIYKTAFENDKLGLACALSILFLVIINLVVKRIVIYFPQYAQRLAEEKENKRIIKEWKKKGKETSKQSA
jgi:multiple sugar transport system permease protein